VGILEGSSDGLEELVGTSEIILLGKLLGIDDLVGKMVDGTCVDGSCEGNGEGWNVSVGFDVGDTVGT
jgi:hypothetical protein